MEQTIMVLVFALAAALCLRVFVWSDLRSLRNEARDQALLQVENAAELLKSGQGQPEARFSAAAQQLGGGYADGGFFVHYDEDWNPVSGETYAYRLTAQTVPADTAGLVTVQIQVSTAEETPDVLFSLDVAWQGEVDSHG
jgi:type II secretory pathway pseudopilin PulG